MKNIKKIIPLLILVLAMAGAFTSCKKDEQSNGGVPKIQYVRVTAPESSDSLLVSASQGSLVAIMGENLQNTVEVWFNDQKASLTSTYITSSSILVSVPNPIPTVITNKLKLVFSNKDSLLYDFKVDISEPVLTGMENE
jgi:hypothetical protein